MTENDALKKLIRALQRQIKAGTKIRQAYQLGTTTGNAIDELRKAEDAERAARHSLKEAS